MSRTKTARRRFRHVSQLLVVVVGLVTVGSLYSAFAPGSGADTKASDAQAVKEGKKLYESSCVTCHGNNAQGVQGQGPSLVGVGSAAVEFQVTTGRMPAARQESQIERKKPKFDQTQAEQMGAYIQSLGGGPELPPSNENLRDGDMANGGRLFRLNCASCHNFTGEGGALSSGKFAPSLKHATDRELYGAMLTGPQNMPVFGDNQLTPQDKKDIITYVKAVNADKDPGGHGLGRIGPVSEGLVIWLGGITALLLITLWIGVKS
jgi:ubiquinol-cytochrome c reductase cytochrome c subunit